MATAQQLKALLESYGDADGEMFVSVALQIAAHEARAGKGKLATSNAEQVTIVRSIIENLSLEVASPSEAREMLQLKGGDQVSF